MATLIGLSLKFDTEVLVNEGSNSFTILIAAAGQNDTNTEYPLGNAVVEEAVVVEDVVEEGRL